MLLETRTRDMIAEVTATIGTKTLSMFGLVTPEGIEVHAISLLETMAAFGYRKSQLFAFAKDATIKAESGLRILINPGEHFA